MDYYTSNLGSPRFYEAFELTSYIIQSTPPSIASWLLRVSFSDLAVASSAAPIVVEQRRRAHQAVHRGGEQQAQLVDEAGVEERAVDAAAALDEQAADAEARRELKSSTSARSMRSAPPKR